MDAGNGCDRRGYRPAPGTRGQQHRHGIMAPTSPRQRVRIIAGANTTRGVRFATRATGTASQEPASRRRPIDHSEDALDVPGADRSEVPAVRRFARPVAFDPPLVPAEIGGVRRPRAADRDDALHHLEPGPMRMLDDHDVPPPDATSSRPDRPVAGPKRRRHARTGDLHPKGLPPQDGICERRGNRETDPHLPAFATSVVGFDGRLVRRRLHVHPRSLAETASPRPRTL